MDKNTIIGIVLIALILITFQYVNTPDETDVPRKKSPTEQPADSLKADQPTDSIGQPAATVEKADSQAAQQPAGLTEAAVKADTTLTDSARFVMLDSIRRANLNPNLPDEFQGLDRGEEKLLTLENDRLKVKVNTKGGALDYVELVKYQRYDSSDLVLWDDKSSEFFYRFISGDNVIETKDLYFTTDGVQSASDGSQTLTMRLSIAEDRYMEQIYTLPEGSYELKYDVRLVGFNQVVPRSNPIVNLNWGTKILRQEKGLKDSRNYTTVHYKYVADDPDYLSESGSEKLKLEKKKTRWVSFKQHFFMQALIFDKPVMRGGMEIVAPEEEETAYVKAAGLTNVDIGYNFEADERFNMTFLFAPNKFKLLEGVELADAEDLQMEEQIHLGWGPIGWVSEYLIIPVFNLLNGFISSYGLIIFLLTVLIKLTVLPLTYKSYLSQAKMKVLRKQPEFEEIKKKHEGDMQARQQAQMALYRKAGVSPLGGCLPMVMQMPILFAMFRFFPNAFELRQQSFLWAEDLSTYDSILQLSFTIPFYGDHVSLFTLLMAGSTMLYVQMNSSNMADGPKEMKYVQYMMPVMLLFFFNSYAAGLSYYYFVYNIMSYGQQAFFKRLVNEDAIHAKIEANKQKKKTTKKSAFQQRLDDFYKQQQEKAKQQQERKNKR